MATILDYIQADLPTSHVLSAGDLTKIDTLIKKWQMFFQSNFDILDADREDETKWPPLVNVLIGKLVIYDLVTVGVTGAMLENNLASTSTSSSKGGIKSIQTGPAKAEWYDAKESASTFWKTLFTDNGLWQNFLNEICMYAKRVGVSMPFCPALKSTKLFIVSRKSRCKC